MPFIMSTADHLPHIDPAPSADALSKANALIEAELAPEHAGTLHPSIPAQRESRFSDLVESEHARLATGQPRDGGLDMSRYELSDAPTKGDLPAWKSTLERAYASHEYLRGREINLGLLETYGKNAWLVANSQLEDHLRRIEKELEVAKEEFRQAEEERRIGQAQVGAEMQGLDEGWKTGVGRMIETQAAGERLKKEVLERKRLGAS